MRGTITGMLLGRDHWLRVVRSLALIAATSVEGCALGFGECWCPLDGSVPDGSDARVSAGRFYTGQEFCTVPERDQGCLRFVPPSGPLPPPELP